MRTSELRHLWARDGAQARLKVLLKEVAAIYAAFPALRERERARKPRAPRARKPTRPPMSQAQKDAMAEGRRRGAAARKLAHLQPDEAVLNGTPGEA